MCQNSQVIAYAGFFDIAGPFYGLLLRRVEQRGHDLRVILRVGLTNLQVEQRGHDLRVVLRVGLPNLCPLLDLLARMVLIRSRHLPCLGHRPRDGVNLFLEDPVEDQGAFLADSLVDEGLPRSHPFTG